MRKFLRRIVIFSSIIIVILALGEVIVRSLPTSYSYKNNWIVENGSKVRTLVLGSSHTYYGLRPELLGDSTFNLANISQTPEYDLALLSHYLPSMPNVKRVIIPISYFTYRDPMLEKGDEWMLAVRYKIHMGLPMHSDISIYNLEISDFDAYKGKLKNMIVKGRGNICDSLGFGLGFDLASRDPRWKDIGRQRAEKHTLSTPGRYDEVRETQDSLMMLARRHGLEIIFITTPASEAYIEALDRMQLAEMKKGIEELVRDHDVAYYDFMSDPRFSDSDFYDPDHLSDVGAAKFSKLLSDTISKKN
ncbi:MAG: hypothetical protein K2L45_04920 [Muribaculaceae bacterium]|nr:hypothetical protein [Muribaculaceae bacterium]